MFYTYSDIAVKGVDALFINKYNAEHPSASLEFLVCQTNVTCCKGLADKCQRFLTDTSCICYFVKQLVGHEIHLLLQVRAMEY